MPSEDDISTIIAKVAEKYLPDDYESFIKDSFITVLVETGKSPSQTQSRAVMTGKTFELCIIELFDREYPDLSYGHNVSIPDAGLGNRHGADFVIYESEAKEDIVAVIEAKGSADRLEWPDGTIQDLSRPGLQRTDTMKKAVAQAYQIKRGLDQDVEFYILTTHKPESGSGKKLYDLAVGDIIDDVIDVMNPEEMNQFVSNFTEEKP